MAVQAHPTNIITPDHRNRVRQSNMLTPAGYAVSNMEDLQQLQNAIPAGGLNPFRLFEIIASSNRVQPTFNGTMIGNYADLSCSLHATRKRSRGSGDPLNTTQRPQELTSFEELHHSSSILIPPSAEVPKRLVLDDNTANSSTSSNGNIADSSNFLSLLPDISSQLQQQKDEVDLFIKVQGEQMRQMVEMKRQQYVTALLGTIEERLFKRLRESTLEAEKVNRKNTELEYRIKQLSTEVNLWQKQAKSNEALVAALRCNLQQAVALSREQSREGCGDSEDDDAASSHRDDSVDAHARAFRENRELKEQKTCRVCRCNDVSILLLPCRHLCLCKDCEARLDACPICRSSKTASVQVYLN